MRTTVTLDDEVAAAVAWLRRERGLGVSAAVNELARRGLTKQGPKAAFTQHVSDGGVLLDVTNVGAVLDLLDDPTAR